jgi:UDP-N-acetylglucosamine/UDP-N-acetylgalactosamine 4-epimerase
MAKYLVTGAAGFIGSNLVEHLLDSGQAVVALDNFSTGFEKNLNFTKEHPHKNMYTFIKGDIRSSDTCLRACEGVDYVLHQAALGSVPRSIEQPLIYNENNIAGTLNMLMAAKENKVKRFVFASSSSVYGDTEELPKVETMLPRPKSPYAISKITGEYYCKVFAEVYNLPTIALRYFNVFGKRQDPNSQYAAVVPKFVVALMENEAPTIFGDGEQTRDFTFIENVIKANLNACKVTLETYGKAYNVGCHDRISINMLFQTIKSVLQASVAPVYAPLRAGDVRDSLAAIEEAKKDLGYDNLVELEAGLKKTIDWYKHSNLAV